MRLTVLAGCRDLLRPVLVPGTLLAGILGPRLQPATAFWISPRCGRFTHDFLLDSPDDGRAGVFAEALGENFGRRTEPLVVLPDLLEADEGGRAHVALLADLWTQAALDGIVLSAVALPDGTPAAAWPGDGVRATDAREAIAARARALAAAGVPAARIETGLIPLVPELPGFEPLYRNLLATRLAERIAATIPPAGLLLEPEAGKAAAWSRLEAWSQGGFRPDPALDDARFATLAAGITLSLTTNVPPTPLPSTEDV